MKNRWVLVMIACLACSPPASAQLAKEAAVAKAESILGNLRQGKTAEVAADFNDVMAKAISENGLRSAWTSLVDQVGAFKSIDERREGEFKAMQIVELILSFEKEKVVQRVAFDAAGRIAGLSFQPASLALLPAK